ncbi:MAG: hypothetical protein ACFHX7_05445 [Pseudomonadota bacterium]
MAVALPVGASPVFFIEANSYPTIDANGDLSFQSAVGSFVETDLNNFSPGQDVDSFVLNGVTIDMGLSDDGIVKLEDTVETFWGGYSAGGGSYGTVSGGAFLNRGSGVHDYMMFDFDAAVSGFGAWIFDDGSEQGTFTLTVTESDGTVTVSSIMDGNNGAAFFVEGFLGVTSDIGITRIAIRTIDPQLRGYFELDHIQLATGSIANVPAPGTVFLLLGGLLPLRFFSYLRP